MTIKSLRNKCDRLFQEWGRKTYTKCLVCGKDMNCLHHYFPKSTASALRYDKDNAIPLCQGCHFRHHNGDPRIAERILSIKGHLWHDELVKKKNQVIKINQSYYKEIINHLINQ